VGGLFYTFFFFYGKKNKQTDEKGEEQSVKGGDLSNYNYEV